MKKRPPNYRPYSRVIEQLKSQIFVRTLGMILGMIVGLLIALFGAFVHYSLLDKPLSLSLGIVGATLFWLTAAFVGAIIGWQSAWLRGILYPQASIGSVPSASKETSSSLAKDNPGCEDVRLLGADCDMKILFLAANPSQTAPLDLEEELRSLEFELRGVKYRDHIQMIARHAVRPDDLVRYVRAEKPNIIHFSGHGAKDGIILRTDGGGFKQVDGTSLRRFLEGRGVDLVVLNACFSRTQAESIKTSVKSVVGTTDAVDDEAARRFSVAFYRALGDGLPVSEAFRDGVDATLLHGFEDVFYRGGQDDITFVS